MEEDVETQLDEPVRCPACDAGPGRQVPLYVTGHGWPYATGQFRCEVCRTEYAFEYERRIDQDPDTGEWVGSEWRPHRTRPGYVEQVTPYGTWPRFNIKAEAKAWRDRQS